MGKSMTLISDRCGSARVLFVTPVSFHTSVSAL
uniref:Uncharacterized protein n=1 Tax=Anguilla anguilla TaxID=7936 RepID=A0A0E9RDS0_ANGAN